MSTYEEKKIGNAQTISDQQESDLRTRIVQYLAGRQHPIESKELKRQFIEYAKDMAMVDSALAYLVTHNKIVKNG